MMGRAVSVPGQERRGRRRPPGRADVVQGRRACGHREFSMAVVQANNLLEDQSQVESGLLSMAEPGPHGTFVGVYDVHGGPETSRFVNDNMFHHLKRFATEHKCMSADVIQKAFQAKTASSRWSARNGLGSLRLQL